MTTEPTVCDEFSDEEIDRMFKKMREIFSKALGLDWGATARDIALKINSMSVYEFGSFLVHALDHGYFPSLRKLNDEFNGLEYVMSQLLRIKSIHKTDLYCFCKYRDIAQLPTLILDAYPARSSIKLSSLKAIQKLLLSDPDLILSRAMEISKRPAAGERINALNTYRQLISK